MAELSHEQSKRPGWWSRPFSIDGGSRSPAIRGGAEEGRPSDGEAIEGIRQGDRRIPTHLGQAESLFFHIHDPVAFVVLLVQEPFKFLPSEDMLK